MVAERRPRGEGVSEPEGRGAAWTEQRSVSEPEGRGVAWTEERGTSDEGRRRSEEGWGDGWGPAGERDGTAGTEWRRAREGGMLVTCRCPATAPAMSRTTSSACATMVSYCPWRLARRAWGARSSVPRMGRARPSQAHRLRAQ